MGGRATPPFLHAPCGTFSNYLGHLALLRGAHGLLVALPGRVRCVGQSSAGGGVKIVQGRGRAGRGGPDAGALRFYRLRGEEAASRITGQPARAAHAPCLIASGSAVSLGGTAESGPRAAQLRTQGMRGHRGGRGRVSPRLQAGRGVMGVCRVSSPEPHRGQVGGEASSSNCGLTYTAAAAPRKASRVASSQTCNDRAPRQVWRHGGALGWS